MIGISIAFGILAGSIDGALEGIWVNERTDEGLPSLTKAQHLRLWAMRFAIIGAYVMLTWIFEPLRRWEPVWTLLIAGGFWATCHRLSMNITRNLEYPNSPWYRMGFVGYDGIWMWVFRAQRTAFLAACLSEIALAVFAIFKLT